MEEEVMVLHLQQLLTGLLFYQGKCHVRRPTERKLILEESSGEFTMEQRNSKQYTAKYLHPYTNTYPENHQRLMQEMINNVQPISLIQTILIRWSVIFAKI